MMQKEELDMKTSKIIELNFSFIRKLCSLHLFKLFDLIYFVQLIHKVRLF
jgi:hypothetical protein